MEHKQVKMDPKKHQTRAKIIKGVKVVTGVIASVGTIAYAAIKQVKKD